MVGWSVLWTGARRRHAGRDMDMSRLSNRSAGALVIVLVGCFAFAAAKQAGGGSWFDALIKQKQAAQPDRPAGRQPVPLPDFGKGKYTFCAWIRTTRHGSIFAKAPARGKWAEGGKSLFIADGKVSLDIGWVGTIRGRTRVTDGKWHHVALSGGQPQKIYVDGKLDATGRLDSTPDVKGHVFKLGYTSTDFPEKTQRAFSGDMDDVRVYGRVLSEKEIKAHLTGKQPERGRGLVACWPLDGDAKDASGGLNHAMPIGSAKFVDGKYGKALRLSGRAHMVVSSGKGASPDAALWGSLRRQFSDRVSAQEMAQERADGIWGADWKTVTYAEAAKRYTAAAQRPSSIAGRIAKLAASAKTPAGLKKVRELYLKSKRYEQLLEKVAEFKLKELRGSITALHKSDPAGRKPIARLDALEKQASEWTAGPPAGQAFEDWKQAVAKLRRDVLFNENPLFDFDKLVFVKRQTYHSSHFYTDFIDGCGRYGGNLCILDLKTGKVTDLIPEMKEGIFGRFDLHFSAKRIVFDWKKAPREGFRIYEIDIDPARGIRTGGPRQLTFPPPDEQARIKKYDNSFLGGTARMYYHQTDDMHPCYLPDRGIIFTSTRCEFGTLCDAPDVLSTPVIYRMDLPASPGRAGQAGGDGKNMEKLTNSPVSEFSPSMMSDGRVLYTRWEYVDKGQLGVKCLWAMFPDGSGTVEVYGNDIQYPPSFLHGRQIPGYNNMFVFLGTPHYPQSGIGTVIRIDMSKNIRTREPMTYITPHVDIRQEPGWNHLVNGRWVRHTRGPLYMDPYPLSKSIYLVSHNPNKPWSDPKAYALYLISESGAHEPIYRDPEISCWQPYPLRPRRTPPVLRSVRDPELAKKNLAVCTVQDVHFGMEGIKQGEVKYLRIMEQLPRPWDSRRFWDPRNRLNHHTRLVSRGSVLAAKVMYGVVPVEADGSAYFLVPADRCIYFQALDENYMELQRERTYVNYRPGEKRSCVGCHETPNDSPPSRTRMSLALKRPPSKPGPQPGDKTAARIIDYPTDVQPVLDKYCVRCHGASNPKAKLDLTGALTTHFSRSYENILRRRLVKTFDEGSDWGGTPYSPPKTVGSHASRFIARVRKGCTGNDRKLPLADFVKLATWVDANAQYYGTYYGRKNIKYKGHPNFRPVPTFEQAISTTCWLPVEKR